jgi:hypothetical protein
MCPCIWPCVVSVMLLVFTSVVTRVSAIKTLPVSHELVRNLSIESIYDRTAHPGVLLGECRTQRMETHSIYRCRTSDGGGDQHLRGEHVYVSGGLYGERVRVEVQNQLCRRTSVRTSTSNSAGKTPDSHIHTTRCRYWFEI